MDDQLIRWHLPVLVLGILDAKPMHGYALAREIKLRGGDKLSLGDGTLYPLLYRLEAQGHLRAKWTRAPNGKERKVYRTTSKGKKRLRQGREEWFRLNDVVKSLLGEDWNTA